MSAPLGLASAFKRLRDAVRRRDRDRVTIYRSDLEDLMKDYARLTLRETCTRESVSDYDAALLEGTEG